MTSSNLFDLPSLPEGHAFTPLEVDPVALAVAIAEGLQMFDDYCAHRAEQGLPPTRLNLWPFIAASSPDHLLPAVLRWMDDMLVPTPSN